jgi:hypothetical protein
LLKLVSANGILVLDMPKAVPAAELADASIPLAGIILVSGGVNTFTRLRCTGALPLSVSPKR